VDAAQKRLAIARGIITPILSVSGSWGTGYSGIAREIDPNVAPVITPYKMGITQLSRDTVLGYDVNLCYKAQVLR